MSWSQVNLYEDGEVEEVEVVVEVVVVFSLLYVVVVVEVVVVFSLLYVVVVVVVVVGASSVGPVGVPSTSGMPIQPDPWASLICCC